MSKKTSPNKNEGNRTNRRSLREPRRIGVHGIRPTDDTVHDYEDPLEKINYPVKASIVRVYYSNELSNISRLKKHGVPTQLDHAQLGEYHKSLVTGTAPSGERVECDVRVVEGGLPKNVDPTIENVPLCLSFGGVRDFVQMIPTGRTNKGYSEVEDGTGDGDYVIVQFIGGKYTEPVITGFFPNPINTSDPAKVIDGKHAKFRYNGVQLDINRLGELTIDTRLGGEIVEVGRGGNTRRHKTDGNLGSITVMSKNDIIIAAGTPFTPGEEIVLPF